MTRKEKTGNDMGNSNTKENSIILTQNPETIRERVNKLGDEKKKNIISKVRRKITNQEILEPYIKSV